MTLPFPVHHATLTELLESIDANLLLATGMMIWMSTGTFPTLPPLCVPAYLAKVDSE